MGAVTALAEKFNAREDALRLLLSILAGKLHFSGGIFENFENFFFAKNSF